MKEDKLKQILIQFIPFIIAFLIPIVYNNEIFFTLIVLVALGISLKISYEKGEWKVIVLGILLGFLLEVVTGFVYRLQYWNQNSL